MLLRTSNLIIKGSLMDYKRSQAFILSKIKEEVVSIEKSEKYEYASYLIPDLIRLLNNIPVLKRLEALFIEIEILNKEKDASLKYEADFEEYTVFKNKALQIKKNHLVNEYGDVKNSIIQAYYYDSVMNGLFKKIEKYLFHRVCYLIINDLIETHECDHNDLLNNNFFIGNYFPEEYIQSLSLRTSRKKVSFGKKDYAMIIKMFEFHKSEDLKLNNSDNIIKKINNINNEISETITKNTVKKAVVF